MAAGERTARQQQPNDDDDDGGGGVAEVVRRFDAASGKDMIVLWALAGV